MKKYFTHLLAVVACLAASLTASAQYSATVEQIPVGYEAQDVAFSLAEVAATLETDAATLGATLTEWIQAEEAPAVNYVYLNDPTVEGADNYTQGGRGGYWMTKEGTIIGWSGDGANGDAWYNTFGISEAGDQIVFGIGQHPDAFEAGEEVSAKFVLVFNEKQATFDITLKIIEDVRPPVEVPEATTFISKLQIVGSQTIEVQQDPRTSYASDPVSVDLTGVAELLGADPNAFVSNLADLLYTTTFVTENELPLKTDSLSNEASAGAPGWWFAQVYDPELQITSDEVVRKGYGPDCSFFIEAFSYDEETATLTGNLGQYPSNLKVDDVRIANVYIIWGDKAYQITYKLTIIEKETQGLDGMNNVGSQDFSLEFEVVDDYDGGDITLDTQAIMTALGVEAWKDIAVMVLDANGGLTAGGTANKGGSWLTDEGTLTNWGNNSFFFFEPSTQDDWSVLSVGQYPNKLDYDTEYSFHIYFVYGENYYDVTVNVKTLPGGDEPGPDPGEKVAQSEYHSVGEITVNIQAVPEASDGVYEIPTHFTYDGQYVAELVGTDKPTLFTNAAPSEDPEADKYSNGYTCTPHPGFWMSRDGYVTGWSGTESPWGATFSIADAEITFYQYPGFADNVPGKTYKAPFYLVNEYTGAMVTFNVTLRFVSEIVEVEEVGSQDIMLSMGEFTLDLSAAMDSLGVKELEQPMTADDLINSAVVVPLADGTFSEPMNGTADFCLTERGVLDESENYQGAALDIYFDYDETPNVKINVSDMNDFELTAEKSVKTKIGFQVEGKRYVYNITFVDPETYTGVAAVRTQIAPAGIYDLSGRRVKSATRHGVFIRNGQKVVR